MNPTDQTQSEGTLQRALQSPGCRLLFGVVVLALVLYAGYAFFTDSQRLVPIACALVAGGLFLIAEAYYYSGKKAAILWVCRTVVSGLLASPLHFLWAMIAWSPLVYLHIAYSALVWITGNLFMLVCLYFLLRWIFGLSRTDALNLAFAAMVIAAVVYAAVWFGFISSLPRL